ncbi:MAG: hypothetical protein ACKO5Q_17400, partial [Microcystaceae cyanobacterium]
MLRGLPLLFLRYPRLIFAYSLIALLLCQIPILTLAIPAQAETSVTDTATLPSSPQGMTTGTDLQPYRNQAIARVTEFQLANGMKFIVMENHDAPVVSFYTYANVGGANEPVG